MLIANTFFIIGSVVPVRNKLYNTLLKIIFVVTNFSFLCINVVDVEFFSFLGKKMTFDVFDMGSDIIDQSLQLVSYYWYLALICFIFLFILIKLYPQNKKNIMYVGSVPFYKVLPFGLVIIVLTFIGIRGGVQLRSISPKQAYIFDSYELGNLALNASYTVVRSMGKKKVKTVKYFNSDRLAFDNILRKRIFTNSELNLKKQNVVFIVLESFSQEYVDQGYTPFLSKLSEKSLYYNSNYANGRRSLEALPSILSGFPSLIGKPIYQSQFQANEFLGLPQILKNSGYQTSFFHGGKLGTMDFDAYCKSVGIEKYYAMEDYPNQDHYDGHWGIYDHHFLNYFTGILNKQQEPFFSSIFTLSSHQPYSIPPDIRSFFSQGSLEIHKSIQYVDNSLKDFFERVKGSSWYENTLFVITADHTQKLETKKFQNQLGHYRVPLMFFHPLIDLSQFKKDRITQHVDILPTVLDILGINEPRKLYFGSSVLNEDSGRMINFVGGKYLFLKDKTLLLYSTDDAQQFHLNEDSSLTKENEVNTLILEELKSYIQYTINGLKKNNIYHKAP
jgi:phosphoglycerol transferase MdoB-like AlkP superfamily enzyme